ncbi:chaplin [Actinacidiphila acidipaludis]|uniref:Chaplin n=1 Tax=Actinacidiphila acidipaludis TaxID=2873382 RepID=A0ABS7Q356_9ACTN|nr:chaplin [Streptomyces acidipaludis]MBY8877567.1 chaplin [Streptomyces acidipaludis]
MRQILSRSLLTAAAAGSLLAATGGWASADSDADGTAAGSPGVLSGNSISAPVDVPVNVCGNSVDAVGALNPAFGDSCATTSSSHARSGHSGAAAHGDAHGSPGVLSGNDVQIPVHAPVNVCGNTVDVVALLDPAFGDHCAHGEQVPVADTPQPAPPATGTPDTPAPDTPGVQVSSPPLADTGFSGSELGAAGATSAALLLGGAILYRRGLRPAHALIGRHRRHAAHARS